MEQTNQTTEIKNVLSADKKTFIGFLLSLAGIIFLFAGVMFFIALACAIYFRLDLVIGLIIGSLVIGVASFAVGSNLNK